MLFGPDLGLTSYALGVDYCENCQKLSKHEVQRSNVRSIYSGFKAQPYSIQQCKLCQFSYTFPQPTQQQLNAIYKDSYAYGVHAALEGELRARAKHIAKFIDRHTDKKYPIVELGCGSGILLEEMACKNRIVYGVEISKAMVSIAQSRLTKYTQEKHIYMGENFLILGGRFDFRFDLIMNHALEHFVEPSQFISDLAKKMTSGSNLFIIVPNSQTILRTSRNRFWGYWQVPIHVSHYSKQSMDELLKINNFERVHFFSRGSSLSARFLTFVNLLRIDVKTNGTGAFRLFSFLSTFWGKTYRFGTGELMIHARKM